jgi:hypothetical protein
MPNGPLISRSPSGVGMLVARLDEHGASAVTSERSEEVRCIEP